MQISASTSLKSGSSGGSSKAAIMRQIRRLEEKKQELLEKLSGKGSSQTDTAELSKGSLVSNQQQSSGEEGSSLGAQLGQAIRSFSESLTAPAEMPDAASEDPEQISKQIELIEMQIMMLRRRLGEDGESAIEGMPEDASGEDMASMVESVVAERSAAAVGGETASTSATTGGVVDTYA